MSNESKQNKKTSRKAEGAALSVAVCLMLSVLKLGVGLMVGSVGVLSEALHSMADLMAASIAYVSIRAASRPPDFEHPYGHGKIEHVSGLIEGNLILVGAALIVLEAVWRLMHPLPTAQLGAPLALGVMALSVVMNALLSTRLSRLAVQEDSPALKADSMHLKMDTISSLAVLLGLMLSKKTGWPVIDPLVGLGVAALAVQTAYRLLADALHPLIDARLPKEEEEAIIHVLKAEERVLGYHKLRTRKSGSRRDADVHVQIEDDSTLVQAHNLTEELEDRIRSVLPAIHISIHIEPYHAEMDHQKEEQDRESGQK